MKIDGKTVVVTGAASGIGCALAQRFRKAGAGALVLADLQEDALHEVATALDATPVVTDVGCEDSIRALIETAETTAGPIDVFCSNAGICDLGGLDAPDSEWQRNWDIHVMAHLYAARILAPQMAERGSGYLVNTASAAGLLTHVHSATYSVTKHAAVAFAEWLSITYGDRGVLISVLCPQAVRTAMTAGREDGVASVDGMLEPEVLADCVVETMDREEFLILPHPIVLEYLQGKVGAYDLWLSGMRRLLQKYSSAA